ncbi:hypothetical protein FLJC2902T_22910 [Flavobacterium limnosediminis JC2902]|uniref:Uncharacterized protein n=1 Tax=Flavobacterium limnosediminis JC2902 TaxID=1341181 RepID=V6SK27_9FLAO|nr:hypothetical protein FLJC2902T_22910 [Flavobacterium limnosediminis JC2902]
MCLSCSGTNCLGFFRKRNSCCTLQSPEKNREDFHSHQG